MRLTREDIISGITDLVQRCRDGGLAVGIHIVGGAAIALEYHHDRPITSDVDAWVAGTAAGRIDVDELVATIAADRGWPSDWFNTKASMFIPDYGDSSEWTPIMTVGDVNVFVASAKMMLAMKLRAGRGRRDLSDLPPLIAATGVTSRANVQALYDEFYPHDPMADRSRSWLDQHFGGA
jgi:hypothetical protein